MQLTLSPDEVSLDVSLSPRRVLPSFLASAEMMMVLIPASLNDMPIGYNHKT
jgi:hypothetical protein